MDSPSPRLVCPNLFQREVELTLQPVSQAPSWILTMRALAVHRRAKGKEKPGYLSPSLSASGDVSRNRCISQLHQAPTDFGHLGAPVNPFPLAFPLKGGGGFLLLLIYGLSKCSVFDNPVIINLSN